MADDVLLAKAEIIERCLRRIQEEYAGCSDNLLRNWTKQDSILLNLERSCQACIDAALRIIKMKQLGLPKESREAFAILLKHELLPEDLASSLQSMVGFRNIAIHNYREIDLRIVETIITEKTDDFKQFVALILKI